MTPLEKRRAEKWDTAIVWTQAKAFSWACRLMFFRLKSFFQHSCLLTQPPRLFAAAFQHLFNIRSYQCASTPSISSLRAYIQLLWYGILKVAGITTFSGILQSKPASALTLASVKVLWLAQSGFSQHVASAVQATFISATAPTLAALSSGCVFSPAHALHFCTLQGLDFTIQRLFGVDQSLFRPSVNGFHPARCRMSRSRRTMVDLIER